MADRVLITGARAVAALDIARDFKRLGFVVHVADCSGGTAARLSKSVDACHHYCAPRKDLGAFGQDLTRIVSIAQPRIIIPTCEEVFHLARLPRDHIVHQTFFAPPLSILRRLHDKAAFAALCYGLSLPVPETHVLTSSGDLEPFSDALEKWVFKPCFSRFGSQTLVGPSRDDLRQITPTIADPWVAQARVQGQEICLHFIAHAGVITAFGAYRGTWRLRSGASLGFQALDGVESLPMLDIAHKLAQGLALTGQFGCDLIVDPKGQPYLIECNPRATSGVHLFPHDGSLAKAYLTPDMPMLEAQSPSPLYLGAAISTLALADALGSGGLHDWRAVMRAGRDVVGIKGDRWPVIGAIWDGLGFMARGAAHGISATAATTMDIEWNGETHDQPIT
jgi:hypothetical protein